MRTHLSLTLQINGLLVNSGNDLSIDVDDDGPLGMTFYSGPVCYRYKVKYIKIHFGINDYTGSEHRIAGKEFPAEVRYFHFFIRFVYGVWL